MYVPERDVCALSLSKGTSQRFDKLSGHSLSENRRHSIWVVRGKSDYPKIATKPDVLRLVHGPSVYLVTPVKRPLDELGVLLDQCQIWADDSYPIRQLAVTPPAKIIFDEQRPFQSRQ